MTKYTLPTYRFLVEINSMHQFVNRQYQSFLRNFAKKAARRSDKDVGVSGNDDEKFRGSDIKKIRKAYNLSQRCFAAMLDISVRTLQNYEIDRRNIPGTARSLFIFAGGNVVLFKKYYLQKVDKIAPYMESMNR